MRRIIFYYYDKEGHKTIYAIQDTTSKNYRKLKNWQKLAELLVREHKNGNNETVYGIGAETVQTWNRYNFDTVTIQEI